MTSFLPFSKSLLKIGIKLFLMTEKKPKNMFFPIALIDGVPNDGKEKGKENHLEELELLPSA
jgi:hypothetical protein